MHPFANHLQVSGMMLLQRELKASRGHADHGEKLHEAIPDHLTPPKPRAEHKPVWPYRIWQWDVASSNTFS